MQAIVGTAILLTSLAGIVTSLTLLWLKVVKPLFKFTRRLGAVVDAVHDLPEWCNSVDEVLKELKPNGGGSMKDKITKTYNLIKEHTEDPRCHSDQHGPSKE